MPNILHRVSIDAPAADVHQLVATTDGISRWWTGRAVTGAHATGSTFATYFGDADGPAAAFEVVEQTPDAIRWQCVDGPRDWVGTTIDFAFAKRDDGGTTLLFTHAGWAEESEFMHGCSSNWAAYLMSLKSGAETGAFNAFPGGEISRWD